MQVLQMQDIERVAGNGFCTGTIVGTFAADGILIGLGFGGVGAIAGGGLGAAIGEVVAIAACAN